MQVNQSGNSANDFTPTLLNDGVQTVICLIGVVMIGALAITAWVGSAATRSAKETRSVLRSESFRIDVNAAGRREWELMPQIGPSTATRILEDRRKNGPFKSVEDLSRVRGIGPKTVRELKPYCFAPSFQRMGKVNRWSHRPSDSVLTDKASGDEVCSNGNVGRAVWQSSSNGNRNLQSDSFDHGA